MNTSEFAKWCGVEKRTLFHYDDIGLLKPARVRENGYREYTMEQLGLMDMIKIFQACGYPLSEIKAIIEEDETAKYAHMQNAVERIDEKIEQLRQMKYYLHSKQHLLEEYHAFPPGTFRIQPLSVCYEMREVEPDHHFCSFLRDGTFSSVFLDDRDRIWICRASESGTHRRSGTAISFFMVVPAGETDLLQIILEHLKRWNFQGEAQCYIESIPHFLVDDQQSAVLKITVFEKQPEK